MKLVQLIAVTSLLLGGCLVKTGQGTGPNQPAPAPPPSGSGGGGGGGEYVDVAPGCDYPENHCLPADILLVAKKPYIKSYIYLAPARQTGEPSAAGEATFLATNDAKELVSKFFHATRPASAKDLQVGRVAVMVHRQERGFYRKPRDTKEALASRWWMARITDVSGLSQGYVQVAGGYRINADGVRVMDTDKSPTASVAEGDDAQFLSKSHWIISKKPLPAQSYSYGAVAVAVKPPSAETKNEGHFIKVNDGELLWTPHAWRTRPASAADLKVGMHVFMPHIQRSGVYQNGKDRLENTKQRWWISKVVDTSEAFKGVIQVAKGYKISIDAIRIAY